jgi:hypothetical protein
VRFTGPSRFYFFLAWTGWLVGAWALIGGVYMARYPGFQSPYLVEASLALLAPFGCVALADRFSMREYSATWKLLNQSLGVLIADGGAIDALREDMLAVPILRWFAPPARRGTESQLLVATLWLPALRTASGGAWIARFGEWLADAVAIIVLPALSLFCLLGLEPELGIPLGLSIAGFALAELGYSLVRLAGRRQAVRDFFNAWRLEAGTAD